MERGAGIAVERKRGPERLVFGDLTSEAIEGDGAILLRLISGRIPNLKLGPLLRLDSRPACGDATVQPAKSVSITGLTRVSAVRSPEGPLFRATTRTARTRNTAWRRFSPGFQPRISGTGH